ncbi:LysR family transcriptional regulator [Lyngbya confervoides]|uniref:LysR family transcriptional regulator n=1 Tax=Lyngbya confervoides BDU141951 TaxID=1574623 RepID=A0ABD4T2P3_9CYAN|nr:LysR family transcriptional regulator [Lyngbya confervoides]MCM1982804.1 LysR family transcriptional regulator [Lyngbya confervoides BDU141951]
MDKLEAMRVFTEVVNHQGFAAAGRHLGLSRSVVNKLVLQLEAQLGVQLLQRTTRRVSPTDVGRAYHERCLALLAEVEAADLAVAQVQSEPKGRLRLNAPMSFGTLHLAPAVAAFLAQYPNLTLELTLSDRFVDLIEEGFDLTLRISSPPHDSALVTQPLVPIHRIFCASPHYLEAQGTPLHPQDLRQHQGLHYGHFTTPQLWTFGDRHPSALKVPCRYAANNGELLREAALAGLGIAFLPTFLLGDALRTGALVELLADHRPPPLTASLCYPPNRQLSRKIQCLIAFLQDWFTTPPWAGTEEKKSQTLPFDRPQQPRCGKMQQ